MNIASQLSQPNSSLGSELTGLAREKIREIEGKDSLTVKEVHQLETQAQKLHSLVQSVRSSIQAQGQVDLHDKTFSPLIQELKDGGIFVPVPSNGVLTEEGLNDWAKIVDDDAARLTEQAQQLLKSLPQLLSHLKEILEMTMKILDQLHNIIMMIIRAIPSHHG